MALTFPFQRSECINAAKKVNSLEECAVQLAYVGFREIKQCIWNHFNEILFYLVAAFKWESCL